MLFFFFLDADTRGICSIPNKPFLLWVPLHVELGHMSSSQHQLSMKLPLCPHWKHTLTTNSARRPSDTLQPASRYTAKYKYTHSSKALEDRGKRVNETASVAPEEGSRTWFFQTMIKEQRGSSPWAACRTFPSPEQTS